MILKFEYDLNVNNVHLQGNSGTCSSVTLHTGFK